MLGINVKGSIINLEFVRKVELEERKVHLYYQGDDEFYFGFSTKEEAKQLFEKIERFVNIKFNN